MKSLKMLSALVMVLCLLLGLCVIAFADESASTEGPEYYRIRVFGGRLQPGTIYDETILRNTELNLSEKLGINSRVVANNKAYYVKSVLRESGRERSEDKEREQLFNSVVTKDQDYVLVYEVLRNEVKYYVDYIDRSTGNTLRERSGPYYANLGDIVYVAAAEIAGYTPDARFRTNTDGITEGYVFTFRYTRASTSGGGGTTTPTGGGGGGGGAVAGGAAANGNANANAANNPNANPADNPNTPAQPAAPAEPLDIIDEAEVPLAAPDFGMVGTAKVPSAPKVIEPNQGDRIPNWMLIAGMVLLIGLISVLYWYLLFYRKKKKYASMNDDYEILGFDGDDEF